MIPLLMPVSRSWTSQATKGRADYIEPCRDSAKLMHDRSALAAPSLPTGALRLQVNIVDFAHARQCLSKLSVALAQPQSSRNCPNVSR